MPEPEDAKLVPVGSGKTNWTSEVDEFGKSSRRCRADSNSRRIDKFPNGHLPGVWAGPPRTQTVRHGNTRGGAEGDLSAWCVWGSIGSPHETTLLPRSPSLFGIAEFPFVRPLPQNSGHILCRQLSYNRTGLPQGRLG